MERATSLAFLVTACICGVAGAADWSVTPRVSATETWSDNISQAPRGSEQHDFVTQLTSGIGLTGRGKRLRLNFDYQATAVRYARDSSPSRLDHRLQGSGNAELYENHLFLDFSSTVSQQNISSQGFQSTDTVSASNNRETVVTFQASPYWQQRFGRYANATIRYTGSALQNQTSSDADVNAVSVSVSSGSAFPQFPWTFNTSIRREENSSGSTNTFRNFSASVRHNFNRRYGVRVRAGAQRDSLVSSGQGNSLTGAVTGIWTPTPRTNFEAGIEKQAFGNSFLLNASHTMRKASFSFNYRETRTTTARRRLERQLFPIVDAFGDPIENPGLQDVAVPINEPAVSDETFISRRFGGSMSLRVRRTSGSLNINHERRGSEEGGDDTTVMSVNASASRSLSPNSNGNIGASWNRSEVAAGRVDTRYSLNLGYSRTFSRDLSGNIGYTYTKNTSNQASPDSTENRINASATLLF